MTERLRQLKWQAVQAVGCRERPHETNLVDDVLLKRVEAHRKQIFDQNNLRDYFLMKRAKTNAVPSKEADEGDSAEQEAFEPLES